MTAEQRELIDRLFEEASALPAAKQATWLAERCDDAEVRQEVESLLKFARKGDTSLAAQVREMAALVTGEHPAPGDRIGPYEIVALIGRGGMGEVYRARDTNLKREVALKILPPQFARDPERLARFKREAEVLASLNHPNIAQIYGVEERALVMELVEGESPKGPMDFEDAWKIAEQVAAGLEYAHERRVVHRDLKPANLKVMPSGRVKILDFGLAKALIEGRPTSAVTQGPKMSAGDTQSGVILGTAAYMAPEQVKGKEADRRADIWAFAVMLYELMTGEPVFKGKNPAEIMTHVLSEDPDLSKAPWKARRLLRECLLKDPNERLRWLGDVARFLETEPAKAPPMWSRLGLAACMTAAIFAVAFGALAFVHFREARGPESAPAHVTYATVVAPQNTTFDFATGFNAPAISPDGSQIVFGARRTDGQTQLWVRSLDAPTPQPIAGTENARFPFWSPDSRSVGFFADGKLKRVDVAGGPALTLADAPDGNGGAWSPGDVIIYNPSNIGPLQRVAAAGGAPGAATTLHGTNDFTHRFPWFLPDGRHFLFEDQSQYGSNEVMLQIGSLDSNQVNIVGPANSNGVYSSGYLLYLKASTLVAQPFDVRRLATTGEAVPVAEPVRSDLYAGGVVGLFSVSHGGLLAYQTEAGVGGQQLTWFDRKGKAVGSVGDIADFFALELSPDHKSLAATRLGRNVDVWIYDVARGLPRRFTFSPARDRQAIWSPDGRNLVYQSNQRGAADLYRKSADGTGTEELLYANEQENVATSWSPDGKSLLFFTLDPKTQRDIWVLPFEGDTAGTPGRPVPWLVTPFNERFPKFSPDGRWVAYESDDSQRFEVLVAPFNGPGGKRQISMGGGTHPRWRADGKEIFYVGSNGTLMAAGVSAKGASLEVDAIRPLGIPVISGRVYMYDVASDGQHFLVAAPPEQKSSAPLTLVENWTALFKKK